MRRTPHREISTSKALVEKYQKKKDRAELPIGPDRLELVTVCFGWYNCVVYVGANIESVISELVWTSYRADLIQFLNSTKVKTPRY